MKYKATLYHTISDTDCLTITAGRRQKTAPVDVFYLNKKSYKTAEKYFFRDKKWQRDDSLHIEIEQILDY